MANRMIWKDRVEYVKVTCVRGAAWITWEGEADHVLEPGQSLEVRKVRRFCLELLRQGEARLEERGQGEAGTQGITEAGTQGITEAQARADAPLDAPAPACQSAAGQ